MKLEFHKSFHKQASSLKPAQKKRLKRALLQFADNPYRDELYNHPLQGEWKGCRSISFGGDWRVLYIAIDKETAFFIAVGSHSQLYK